MYIAIIRFRKSFLSITSILFVVGCTHTPLNIEGVIYDDKTIENKPSLYVATAIPVIASMSLELVHNTEIDIIYLPPPRYSIKRIPGWLKRQNIDTFPKVDAIAGIASVWPNLNLYPALRLQNIQVVPIDVAHAHIPGGERVVITPSNDNKLGYFWLNPANALIMLGILERDFVSLIHQTNTNKESAKKQIDLLANTMQEISTRLRQFQLKLDDVLSQKNIMQVVIDSTDLYELASATLLPIISLEEAMESEFATLLITNKNPSHKNFKNLPSHIKLWPIDDFAKPRKGSFTQRWLKMVNILEKN
ncbi:MAG: hypothetical protein ACJAW1_003117 [Glaciecola sp.]|jgi:hypothetical protein